MGKPEAAQGDVFNSLEIAELSVRMVRAAGVDGADIGVQIAALRVAAEVLTQALAVRTVADGLRKTQLAAILAPKP